MSVFPTYTTINTFCSFDRVSFVTQTLFFSSRIILNVLYSGPTNVPGKIVLSGRLNLPEGFGPTQFEKRKELPQRSLESASSSAPPSASATASRGKRRGGSKQSGAALGDIAEGSEDSEEEDQGGGEASDASGGSEGEEERVEGGEGWVEKKSTARKRRQETPEEKKARKEAVKKERSAKRLGKKELKNAFKEEGTRLIRNLGTEQSIDHVSVFRYT